LRYAGDELLQGVVFRAVVDDDDLEVRILELQQRLDRCHDRFRLVVCGHDEADRQMHCRVRRVEIIESRRFEVTAHAADGKQTLREVGKVDGDEVREKRPLERGPDLARHQRRPISAMA
jgi:hypothetical protein